jgi:hypothetical protein
MPKLVQINSVKQESARPASRDCTKIKFMGSRVTGECDKPVVLVARGVTRLDCTTQYAGLCMIVVTASGDLRSCSTIV